jgi:hypothetical protein
MDRIPTHSACVLATVLAIVGSLAVGPVPKATASPAATGDFSGLVDIGGRSLYLECRGQGSPTVILEAGRRPGRRLEPGSGGARGHANDGPTRRGGVHPRLCL